MTVYNGLGKNSMIPRVLKKGSKLINKNAYHDGRFASKVSCPSCGTYGVDLVGKIPHAINFAGVNLNKPLDGGMLLRCENCSLGFRHPQLTKKRYDELYSQVEGDAWSVDVWEKRNDWLIARSWITENINSGRVLDVGCSSGEFMSALPSDYQRFGIEINPSARSKATERGINLVGEDLSSIARIDSSYDVVVNFDVIEHVSDPFYFLNCLANGLSENGVLIVSTGNLDAASWRLMKSCYWYCTIPQHISFVSPSWFKWAADRAGLRVEATYTFSHTKRSRAKYYEQIVKNALYLLAPGMCRFARAHGLLGGVPAKEHPELRDFPPPWSTARDHFLTVLRRRPQTSVVIK